MSILYVGCMKFPINRFVRNLCPIHSVEKLHVVKDGDVFLFIYSILFFSPTGFASFQPTNQLT
jgi:hypothetical protein